MNKEEKYTPGEFNVTPGEFNVQYYQICLLTNWPQVCSNLKRADKLDELRERAKKLCPFFDEVLIKEYSARITYQNRLQVCIDWDLPADTDLCIMVHYANSIDEAKEIFHKLDNELFNPPKN